MIVLQIKGNNSMETSPFADVVDLPTIPKKETKKPFDFTTFLKDFRTVARVSTQSRGYEAVKVLKSIAESIVRKFLEFARQAVEIAVSKFLVELCAMIIGAVGGAMMAKHKKGFDITTPGVFYNGGQPAVAQAPSQQPSWGSSSPFDSWPSQPRSGVSAAW